MANLEALSLQLRVQELEQALHNVRSLWVNLAERLRIRLDEEDWDGIAEEIRGMQRDG